MAPKKRPAAAAMTRKRKKSKGTDPGLQESHEAEELLETDDVEQLALEDEKNETAPQNNADKETTKGAGLKESQEQEATTTEPPAKTKEKDINPQKEQGLSNKDREKAEAAKSETKPDENLEDKKKKAAEQGLQESQEAQNPDLELKTPETPEEDTLSLTSTKLKVHEKTLEAVRDLKAGRIQEHEFFQRVQSKDMTALWKKYEWERNKNPEAKQVWNALGGAGVVAKKKNLLLQFLKSGNAAGGCLKESTQMENAKQDKQFFEWVPWLQLCKWYGEKEALERVEEGMIPVRKVKKFYEFLLIKDTSCLTKTQKQIIESEMEVALKGPELKACKKALKAPMDEEDWENFWDNKKPHKGFQLEDALSDSESGLEESQSSDEAAMDPASAFLKSIRNKSPPRKDKRSEKKAPHSNKVTKQAPQASKKAKSLEKKQDGDKKWQQKVEEMTIIEPNKMDSKVQKMLSMITKMVSDFSKACKKANDSTWGAQEMKSLKSSRDELEELMGETDMKKMKEGLVRAADALKQAKDCLQA